MIVYDLRCGNGHVFEEWFTSAAEYEDKAAAAGLQCPECSDGTVSRAITAARVNALPSTSVGPCGRQACDWGACQRANPG